MALKTKVKVGKITNLSDARYCSGMGVDILGFPAGNLSGSASALKNYIEITSWISGPSHVVEWEGLNLTNDFSDLIKEYNADYVEIPASLVEIIPPVPVPLIVTLAISDWLRWRSIVENKKDQIAFLSLYSDGPLQMDHDRITQIARVLPTLLGFGVTPSNLEEVLRLPIAGLSLEGANEEKPGLKDYALLSEILEGLEREE
jgi:phosphoribosylanthranilate isomerase